MIVAEVLSDLQWQKDGLSCPDADKLFRLYGFIRELILDSHLPVTKVIGYSIINKTQRNKAGTYISRNIQIGESYAELVNRFSDKIVFGPNITELKFNLSCGHIKMSDIIEQTQHKILYTNEDLCTVVNGDCQLILQFQTNCGFRDMQQNSSILSAEFFPMYTYFNLNEYIRVLPMLRGATKIPLRFYHGMTVDLLKSLMMRYSMLISQQAMSEEELTWVLNFDR